MNPWFYLWLVIAGSLILILVLLVLMLLIEGIKTLGWFGQQKPRFNKFELLFIGIATALSVWAVLVTLRGIPIQ